MMKKLLLITLFTLIAPQSTFGMDEQGPTLRIIKGLERNRAEQEAVLIEAHKKKLTDHLFSAIGKEDYEQVSAVIAAGANVNAIEDDLYSTDSWYCSTLSLAAMYGNEKMCKLLIDARADVNISDPDGFTPILSVIRQQVNGWVPVPNLSKIITLLISNGAHLDSQGEKDGYTPLMIAATGCKFYEETCRCLLAAGADWRVKNKDGKNVKQLADERKIDRPEISLMIRKAISDTEDLRSAMGRNDVEFFQNLHHPQVNITFVNTPETIYDRPLHMAMIYGNFQIWNALLSAGANPLLPNNRGCTAFEYATRAPLDLLHFHAQPLTLKKACVIALLNRTPEQRAELMQRKLDLCQLEELIKEYPIIMQGIEIDQEKL